MIRSTKASVETALRIVRRNDRRGMAHAVHSMFGGAAQLALPLRTPQIASNATPKRCSMIAISQNWNRAGSSPFCTDRSEASAIQKIPGRSSTQRDHNLAPPRAVPARGECDPSS